MHIFLWLLRAVIFIALLAFALNNRHETSVKWFFGSEWHSSVASVLLVTFVLGALLGVLAMVPSWWRYRQLTRLQRRDDVRTPVDAVVPSPSTTRPSMLFRADGV